VLTTPLSGVVTTVYGKPGTLVKQGELLVQLDRRLLLANAEKTAADEIYWQQYYDEAKRELDRTIEMYERTLLSNYERDAAHLGFAKATAELKSAQARSIKAQLELEYSEIRAPFDGVIVTQYVQIGESVINYPQVQPLVALAESGKMSVTVLLSAKALQSVRLGAKVNVVVAKKTFAAVIESIGVEPHVLAEPKYPIVISFQQGEVVLHVGQKSTVSF